VGTRGKAWRSRQDKDGIPPFEIRPSLDRVPGLNDGLAIQSSDCGSKKDETDKVQIMVYAIGQMLSMHLFCYFAA
jgi:hypothetical protein